MIIFLEVVWWVWMNPVLHKPSETWHDVQEKFRVSWIFITFCYSVKFMEFSFWDSWGGLIVLLLLEEFASSKILGFWEHEDAKILLWRCSRFAILWDLWTGRTTKFFNDTSLSLIKVTIPISLPFLWGRVSFLVSLWALAMVTFRGVYISNVHRDWREVLYFFIFLLH